MGMKEDIKSYIVKSGWSLTEIQEALNCKNGTTFSVQNLSKKINQETIRYNELLEIAEIIGYKIEWIKKL